MRASLILILFAGFGVIEYGMAYTIQERYGGQQEIEDLNSDIDDLIGYNRDEENAINGYAAEEDKPLESKPMQPLTPFDFEMQAEIQNKQRYVIGEAGVVNAHNDPNCNEYNGHTDSVKVNVHKKPCSPHCKGAQQQAAQLVRDYLTEQGSPECHKYVKPKDCTQGPACH